MKRLALAILATTAFAAPALAADAIVYSEPAPMAPVPVDLAAPMGFTGLYIGIQGGGAFNPSDPDRLGINPSFGLNTGIGTNANGTAFANANNGFAANTIGAAFGDSFESEFDSSFIGGVHVGYDYQIDNFVIGAVADINAVDISIRQSAFSNTPAVYTAERNLDYLATARLRAGTLMTDRTLVYATGGLAYGEIDYSFTTNSPAVTTAFPAVSSADDDDLGYTVGGGVEVLLTDNVSFGAEYLYTNLGGDGSFTRLNGGPFDGSAGTAGTGSTDFNAGGDFDFHTVTAKLSYRFN